MKSDAFIKKSADEEGAGEEKGGWRMSGHMATRAARLSDKRRA